VRINITTTGRPSHLSLVTRKRRRGFFAQIEDKRIQCFLILYRVGTPKSHRQLTSEVPSNDSFLDVTLTTSIRLSSNAACGRRTRAGVDGVVITSGEVEKAIAPQLSKLQYPDLQSQASATRHHECNGKSAASYLEFNKEGIAQTNLGIQLSTKSPQCADLSGSGRSSRI
jgi:hypothetical protein